jgi:hypothetical protein
MRPNTVTPPSATPEDRNRRRSSIAAPPGGTIGVELYEAFDNVRPECAGRERNFTCSHMHGEEALILREDFWFPSRS